MGTVTEQLGFAGKDLSAVLCKNHTTTFAPDIHNLLSARLKLGCS